MADLVRLLRAAGLRVVDDRVAPADGTFTPVGVMLHHTAAGTNWVGNLRVLTHGRTGLPGPLCNVFVRRDGIVHVVTDGKANDSGDGSSQVLAEVKDGRAVHRDARARGFTDSDVNGNRWFYDVEVDNRGTGEPYPAVQTAATVAVAAALLGLLGRDVGSLIYHRHWTARKIDPAHCPDFIGLTAATLQEDDMPYSRDELEDIVQDAIFKAGFGRGDNLESFGQRVGHIRVDTRAARAQNDALLKAVQSLSAQVDALASGDPAVASSCAADVRAALAEAGEALAALDD